MNSFQKSRAHLDWVQSLDVGDAVQIVDTSGSGKAQGFNVISLYCQVTFIDGDGRIRVRHLGERKDMLFSGDGHGAIEVETGTVYLSWLLWKEGWDPG